MEKKINLAVQIIPVADNIEKAYGIVDKAIEVIKNSGLTYLVCPFETVIEGDYDKVMQVVKDAQEACFQNGATDIITNLKIQRSRSRDVAIDDKIGKYK